MNYKENKNYVTNEYILNINEVYKDCGPSRNNFVSVKPEKIFAKNCDIQMNYPCPVPNDIKCWYPQNLPNSNEKSSNDIVYQNIQRGGVICEFTPRSNINNLISSRFLTDYVRPPCDYVQDIDTEFYLLLHGENSNCSKYWKNRHSKNM